MSCCARRVVEVRSCVTSTLERDSLVVHYWISIDVQNPYTMAPLPADDKILLVSDHTFEMKASERHYGIEDEQEQQEEKHAHGSTSLR
jgi:hypothetical protein